MIRRLDDATADVGGVLATGDVEHARQAYAIGAAAHAASLVRQRAGQAGLAHRARGGKGDFCRRSGFKLGTLGTRLRKQ